MDEKRNLLDIQISYLIDTNWPKDFELLKTVPGIGQKSAEIYLAEVCSHESISRFGDDFRMGARRVAAYCGVSADKKVSADKVTSHMKRGGNQYIRPVLVQSAQAVLRLSKSDLANWGYGIIRRSRESGYRKAVIALARRIAVGSYHVIRTQTEYNDSMSDYDEFKKTTTKALVNVGKNLNTIKIDADDEKSKLIASQLAQQLAQQAGINFQYIPTEILAHKGNFLLSELGFGKRVCNVLSVANIVNASSLFIAVQTGALNNVKGVGEKSYQECIDRLIELELMKTLNSEIKHVIS